MFQKHTKDSETMISDFDELKLTEKHKEIYVQLNHKQGDAISKVKTVKCNTKFLVAYILSDKPPEHILSIFTFENDFEAFVKAPGKPHAFDKAIVDFCFNPDETWLVICLKDGKIHFRNAANENMIQVAPVTELDYLLIQNVREIICFNNSTVFLALTTN